MARLAELYLLEEDNWRHETIIKFATIYLLISYASENNIATDISITIKA